MSRWAHASIASELRVVTTVLVLATVAAAAPSQTAAARRIAATTAVAPCNLYASPSGDDANSGVTPAQAKQSPITLLNALAAGQTGCLEDGANFTLGGGDAITSTAGNVGQPKVLRPTTPGQRATITTTTGFWIQVAAHDLTLIDLNIRRLTGTGGGSLFLIDGDRITLDGIDATYPANICLDIGEDPRNGAVDPAQDLVLRRSRVHDCGSSYGPPHFQNDSGVHGVYAEFLRDGADADPYSAIIEDNLIYRNHNRGIQLYPDTDDALIQFNVLDQNGANLNIGSQWNLGIASERNLIQNNILTDSVLSGLQAGGFVGDTSEVLGNFPPPGAGVPNFGNQVMGNCISNVTYPNELYEGYGYAQSQNIENQPPQYANRAAGDFTLQPGDPCYGKGPRSPGPTAVKLLRLRVTGFHGGVRITWRIGAEIGVVRYELMRQALGGPMRVLRRLEARGGAGAASYLVIDRRPRKGAVYVLRAVTTKGMRTLGRATF